MNCASCPIQDLCLEYYNKVLILHDYIDERNCPYEKIGKGELMMKSILISIKPQYVAKILNGEKTIEIRRTTPKCDLPIDVYIYCTKGNPIGKFGDGLYHEITKDSHWSNGCSWNMPKVYLEGKVVAKFTLNKVEEIRTYDCPRNTRKCACLELYELNDYLTEDYGYAWHISNLEIFDKPKELSEFRHITHFRRYGSFRVDIEEQIVPLTKAPQSWCYVEE